MLLDEQVSEVLALDDRVALVEVVDAEQSADDVRHAVAVFLLDVFDGLIIPCLTQKSRQFQLS